MTTGPNKTERTEELLIPHLRDCTVVTDLGQTDFGQQISTDFDDDDDDDDDDDSALRSVCRPLELQTQIMSSCTHHSQIRIRKRLSTHR